MYERLQKIEKLYEETISSMQIQIQKKKSICILN